jgi:glycosyltransferase involved in cell wall biosynthesis
VNRSRLKIAIASSGLGHVARGIEAWAADLARALADRNEDVTLYQGGGTAGEPYECVLRCWERGSNRTKLLTKWLPKHFVWRLGLGSDYDIEQSTFALRLIRRLRRNPVDILHVQDPHVARILVLARRFGLVGNATILAHGTNEPWPYLRKFPYLQHLAPWHLEQGRDAGCWKPAWTAIPNFIDTQLYSPGRSDNLRDELQIPRDHLVLLTAAAIKRDHKRIDYLLQEFAGALEAQPHLPVTLVVAGGKERETDELVAQGKQLLGDRVRFLVQFPRHRMPDLFRLADLFVLCSLREMMPIALLEASASGLPCIVNAHPIMTWMTGPGGCPIDLSALGNLATKIQRLTANTGERLDFGRLARSHCQAVFGRDRVVGQILEYYQFVHSHNLGGCSTGVPSSRARDPLKVCLQPQPSSAYSNLLLTH